MQFAKDRLFKGKALIIFGPRQAGKTTFSKQLLEQTNKETLFLNGDEFDTRDVLSHPNTTKLKNIIGNKEIIFIDEAQRIPEIGLAIKIIVDQIPNVQVVATGSSSFDLAGQINEPLTGRKYEMMLLPLSWQEMVNHSDFLTEKRNLEARLIFGSYPEIVSDPANALEHIKLIANSYLYKDIFLLGQIKKPLVLEKLVKALAFQVGSEINVNEISQLIGADNKTVEKYMALLEQSFVIFTLGAYSRNVRNEIKKGRKIYFYDNGIINAITGNFNPLHQRSDLGALWENYLVSERKKWLNIQRQDAKLFFWRTAQQQEIDLIEESFKGISAYEFKWKDKSKVRFPLTFKKAYPKADLHVITIENYYELLQGNP